MGLWKEKALFAGKMIYKILLAVFELREPPALFSVLARTLDFSETSLGGTEGSLQLGSTFSSCDAEALRERPKFYIHKLSGIKLVSTII